MSSSPSLDVVVIGNAGLDTNVYLAGPPDLSREGHFTENLDVVGQAGGYSARGFAALGKRTAFLGFLGEDAAGAMVRQAFSRDGIDTSAVFVDPAGTARSVNLVRADGRRNHFYDGKSHLSLGVDLERCRPLLARARLAHFAIPNWARQLLPLARSLGLTVSVDLQDLNGLDDPYRADFISAADILFFSATHLAEPVELLRELLRRRPEATLVCGLGERGCAVASRAAGLRHFPALQLEAPVRDTNGAGDSLAVGFLSSFVLEGRPLEESIHRGQLAARWCCTLRGTSDGLLTADRLEALARR